MTKLLRLLPLLVVGCLLLQSLQPTAVSGQDVLSDPQGTITSENYATLLAKKKKKNKKPKPILLCNELEKAAANARLKIASYKNNCPSNHWNNHMPFYTESSCAKPLCQDNYVICYSTAKRTPLFTGERLTKSYITSPSPKRIDCFRQDPRLTTGESSLDTDFQTYGFTRGHIVPAGDMKEKISKLNTFVLSNMAPQYKKHNNGPWNDWESYTREIAKELNGIQLFVITGVTGREASTNLYPTFTVPKYFYKVLAWCENGAIQAEYIFSLHKNVELQRNTRRARNRIRWGSSSRKLLSTAVNGYRNVAAATRVYKTVAQVESFIQTNTGINFNIRGSGICSNLSLLGNI